MMQFWHYCPQHPCFLVLADESHAAHFLHVDPTRYSQPAPTTPPQAPTQRDKPVCPNTPCPYDDEKEHKEQYWHQCKYGKHCKEFMNGAVVHLARFKHDLDEPLKDMCMDGYACRYMSSEHVAHKNSYMHLCKKGPIDCPSRNDPVHVNRFVHVNTPFDDPDKTLRYLDPAPASNTLNYMLVNIPVNTHEYKYMLKVLADNGFPANKTIQQVQRVQNTSLWKLFTVTRRLMHSRNNGVLNEKWLFHGMKTRPALDAILQDGFDARVSNIGGSIGACTYFAVQASYSVNGYCYVENGVGHLFIARVLVGHSTQGQTQQRDVPHNPATNAPFDSVLNGSTMYGVFNNAQAYPAYLIKFT